MLVFAVEVAVESRERLLQRQRHGCDAALVALLEGVVDGARQSRRRVGIFLGVVVAVVVVVVAAIAAAIVVAIVSAVGRVIHHSRDSLRLQQFVVYSCPEILFGGVRGGDTGRGVGQDDRETARGVVVVVLYPRFQILKSDNSTQGMSEQMVGLVWLLRQSVVNHDAQILHHAVENGRLSQNGLVQGDTLTDATVVVDDDCSIGDEMDEGGQILARHAGSTGDANQRWIGLGEIY